MDKVASIKKRKTLTIEEQKSKLELERLKLEAKGAKIAVAELKDYIKNLKVGSVSNLFTIVRTNKPDVSDIDILRTLAEIANLKVTITEKPVVKRGKRESKN